MQYLVRVLNNNKFRATILLLIAFFTTGLLITYKSTDPSFNLVTDNLPENILSYPGSYIADLMYQLIGFSSFIIPLCFCFWSYYLFKNGKLKHKYFHIFMMFIAIISISCFLSLYEISNLEGGVVGSGVLYFIMNNIYLVPYLHYVSTVLLLTSLITLHAALGISGRIYLYFVLKILKAISSLVGKLNIKNRICFFDNHNNFFDTEESFDNQDNSLDIKTTERKKIRKYNTNNAKSSSISKTLPGIDLLSLDKNTTVKPQSQEELAEKSEQLLAVLSDFGIKGNILSAREGPVVTMYEFEPAAGTKSSRVISLADDIARSLSAISTRIAVIPGRNALGIELPNKQRMFFRLRELIETQEFQNSNISLPIILGKDLSGTPMVADLAKMPHLLVAGTTGSGKSVAINAMIMSLLYRYTPQDCKMIMIDPKMLELSAYDNIPHLMTPVVTEPSKAVVALKWAVKEMENRYRLMSHLGVRNITNYNTKIRDAISRGQTLERKIQTGFDPETGDPIFETIPIDTTKMPFIVVIVDEMADLMLVAGKDIETSVQRLAQMARAAGIHIIMATQRPSVDVITGVIKANFPSRISFKVTSKIDSRTIIGEQGSEQLLGMGDMLYMGNSSRILRVHGPFVDDSEVEKVTNFLKTTGTPEYVSAITESSDDEETSIEDPSQQDDLYSKALNIVKTQRKSSISYIQRSLRIGYNKSANLVEEMERKGVLSSPNHAGKRDILLPEE